MLRVAPKYIFPIGNFERQMEKKEIIGRILLISLLLATSLIYFDTTITAHQKTRLPRMAFATVGINPDTEMIIVWETATASKDEIRYGTNPNLLNESKMDLVELIYHHMFLTGLSPNTTYYYEIFHEGVLYTNGSFKTAPPLMAADHISRFCFVSDTQPKMGPGWHSRSAQKIAKENYDFVALVGDFVEDGTQNEWWDYFTRASVYLAHTPIVPVRGNHDKPRDNTYYFESYFPQTVDSIKDLNQYDTYNQFFYSFNWSNVHVQVLHFPEVDIDDANAPNGVNPRDYHQTFTEDHIQWIRDDLQRAKDIPFKIALFHCPITGAGFYGPNFIMIEQLLPILHEHNVTATFSGHAHHYERGILQNHLHPTKPLTYFVVGTGGGLADVGLRPVKETQVLFGSPLYTEVIASSNNLTIRAKSLDGHVLDELVISA